MREWLFGTVHACVDRLALCGKRMSATAKIARNSRIDCGRCVRELNRRYAGKR
ncbi:hypothetical protein [Amycolatopsis thermoflava]|uniref:hypothetical protein n=2 Tax=Amycolatopsis TaxID=1813 RepID=UPI0003F8952B|nr:hypothetical protein [Amycolatopsis thermoflava]